MAVTVERTPNPNAMKFSVGAPVGGPQTFLPDRLDGSEPAWVGELLALPGVTSLFMTADFVTLTKDPSADWDDLVDEAVRILETAFAA